MPSDIFHNLTDKLIGQTFACPDGEGFKAKFSDFKVKHLPDQRRVKWLKNNQ